MKINLIRTVILKVYITLLPLITTYIGQMGFVLGCHNNEREALLKFKNTLNDTANRLLSWKGEDCCHWLGITCHRASRRVIHLDLHTDRNSCLQDYSYWDGSYFNATKCGVLGFQNFDPSLVELTELKKLDLSGNSFYCHLIPELLGSMKNLRYLNLSEIGFWGNIPPKLGNITGLQTLDLRGNSLCVNNLQWMSALVNLRLFDLSQNICSFTSGYEIQAFMQIAVNLPSLLDLSLSNYVEYSIPNNRHLSGVFLNSTSHSTSIIQHIDLSGNFFHGPIPNFLSNMSSLKSLDLSYNYFEGAIPLWLKNNRGLEALNLGSNVFSHVEGGSIMGIIGNLCNLKVLDFSSNYHLGGNILSQSYSSNSSKCVSYKLEVMDLSFNNIISTLPDWLGDLKKLKVLALDSGNTFNSPIPESIGNLSLLEELILSNCSLIGYIPSSIGHMSSLTTLNLSSNSLEGLLSKSHFSNLSKLKILDLSFNPLKFDISPDWLPNFQLNEFRMRSCKIKGVIPQWLKTQKELNELDLSNNEIYEELPSWLTSLNLSKLSLYGNQIVGQIPHFSSSSHLSSIDLSYNLLSGLLNKSLCLLSNLNFLDLQSNRFFGEIPDCWGNSQELYAIDFSLNRLSGRIPMTLGLLPNLAYLKLNNNSLEGTIPATLHVALNLMILDLGENKLTGEIPNWGLSTHPLLEILRLRANQLKGVIPSKLCSLPMIKFLDLAHNNLTGSIPHCFGHFKSMKSYPNLYDYLPIAHYGYPLAPRSGSIEEENAMVVFEGAERQYTSTLKFLVELDLSCNGLIGTIPEDLAQLILIKSLNLSYNHLTGFIPNEIGEMKSLISLDLSNNYLSGTIPSSLSTINSLSYLNLSCNKLHGEIPNGPQLQTLIDPSIYANNAGLCGYPLPPCSSEHGKQQEQEKEEIDEGESKFEKVMFILVVMLGFATGFWGVVGTLLLKKTWRHALFRRVEKMTDFLYVQVVARVKRLKK